MSDIESKTENNTATKTSETAPYMKKNFQKKDQPESSKSNIVIPLVLLLVSAFVITATFYQDENSDTLAEADAVTATQKEASIPEKSADEDSNAAQDGDVNPTTEDKIAVARQTTTAEVQTDVSNTAAVASNVVNAKPASDHDGQMQQPNNRITDVNAAASSNHTQIAATYTPYQAKSYVDRTVKHQSFEQTLQAVMTRSQGPTKKHHEIMQQNRKAYEKEMQARRQQFETMVKTQQEKRANIAEKQKALFQRIRQERLASNKRIQEMHEEIHQIRRDLQPHYRNNNAPQILQPANEKIQNI